MQIVVQKFGGSSVADAARMRTCAQRAIDAKREGKSVVVVVSAMGDTTDELLDLAAQVAGEGSEAGPRLQSGGGGAVPRRELDQLMATGEQVSIALMAMTLCRMGHEAVSLTGAQSGILTEAVHTRAKIRSIGPERLMRELEAGRIPVVAGFQGMTEAGETTTLGRGGSDTTAVALAAALKAEVCEIYTDVDGVYSADPRLVPNARLHDRITYDEMMEAASQGAKVMHLRAVEVGKKSGVPIRVLHSQRGTRQSGTLICGERDVFESRVISAVALKSDIGRVTIAGLPNRAGVQRELFGPIAEHGISVDDIIQNEVHTDATRLSGPSDKCTIAFTVEKSDLAEVRPLVERAVERMVRVGAHGDGVGVSGGDPAISVDMGLVKVSAVGVGMQSQSGVAATMFKALADAGIKIQNITTSEIKISCLLAEADGKTALRVVHDAFGLGGEEDRATRDASGAVKSSR
ncbi:MAG: aspartate kinase [Phycisphaerales bacterium]|nr:aspartate kinase [Phycisphaerales bacterium]